MQLAAPEVNKYLDALVPERLPEMQAMEAYAKEHNFPAIGPAVGQLCYLIARMTGARQIFEMGSGYGYSTAWFARAVQENGGGMVHHVVWDDDLSKQARQHLSALSLDALVEFHIDEAIRTLRSAPGSFDIIFNDIDKEAYPESLPVIKEKLRPGGVLIIDNMLWYGRIFDETNTTASTEGVREFTRRISADPDWIVSLIPIRDGVIVAMKR